MRIFSGKHSKRGALDLSINAIVVLILAITMLGLGLAFIRGLFGGAVEKLTGIYASLSEEDKKTLMASQEPITFLQSDIQVSGREVNIPYAIRNVRGDKIGLKIKDNFFCFDAIGVPKTGMNAVLGKLLPQSYQTTSGAGVSVDTSRIENDISQGQFQTQLAALPSKWITFNTYDDRDIAGNTAVVLPLTLKVAADAPSTTFSCAFFPTVIRKEVPSTVPNQPAQTQTMNPPFEIYQKQYFNIVYSK
ncbi:MAG: hypothetical protein AABX47_05590 [Nanoarchaeota archaeon]